MTIATLDETRAAWDAIADGYDTYVTPTHLDIGAEALAQAGVRAGTRFLDVAAGSGSLSIPAARLGATVLAIDLSPVMLACLARRATAEGVEGLEVRAMDGHSLDVDDDSFDVAGSQYGVMLFPDLPRALGEMVRVTKPGGRVLLVVYGMPTKVEFLGFFLGAMQRVVPGFEGLPADPPPLEFQVADPERLEAALSAAGLQDVVVETVTQHTPFASGADLWNWVVNSNPIGRMLVADLDEARAGEVRRLLDEMLQERSSGSGPAVLTDLNHIGVGTVPGA
jgi:ubiquinone/menaquinone biosynthesis C-methylase UbiE